MARAEWVCLLLDSKKHVTGVAVTNALILTAAAYAALSCLIIKVKSFIDVELVHERILQSKRFAFIKVYDGEGGNRRFSEVFIQCLPTSETAIVLLLLAHVGRVRRHRLWGYFKVRGSVKCRQNGQMPQNHFGVE